MNDIVSDLCNLPTGVFSLDFLPISEITGWVGAAPTPADRWYGIAAYQGSLKYSDRTENSDQGTSTAIEVSCLVVNDSQAVADLLAAMHRHRFVLRVHHYDGKTRTVGAQGQYMQLGVSEYAPEEIVGAQGFRLTFAGVLGARPVVG